MVAICKIDKLGRMVIPNGIRKQIGIDGEGLVEVRMEGGQAVIAAHEKHCFICGKTHKDKELMNLGKTSVFICTTCAREINDKAENVENKNE